MREDLKKDILSSKCALSQPVLGFYLVTPVVPMCVVLCIMWLQIFTYFSSYLMEDSCCQKQNIYKMLMHFFSSLIKFTMVALQFGSCLLKNNIYICLIHNINSANNIYPEVSYSYPQTITLKTQSIIALQHHLLTHWHAKTTSIDHWFIHQLLHFIIKHSLHHLSQFLNFKCI